MDCLGGGEYGTCVPSELGDFSSKQRERSVMKGTGMNTVIGFPKKINFSL